MTSAAALAVDGVDGTGQASTAQVIDYAAPKADAKTPAQQNGALLEKGVVYSVQNGQRTPIENELRLPDGTVVHKDGTMYTQGRAGVKLTEGQMVTSAGQVISAGEAAGPTTGATSTSTDQPNLNATTSTPAGNSSKVEASSSSPSGATRNMAPVRGSATTPAPDTSSASGLTAPGASSGSSLGSGSNSTTGKDPSRPNAPTGEAK